MESRFNILALSGGGFLGLYAIAVLAALESNIQTPIARRFDLLAGTSVGGIVALGLAAEVPAAKILKAFEQNGPSIFSERPAPTSWWGAAADIARTTFKPKYRADALRETIVEIVGADRKIGDLAHRVIVPSVNLTRGRPQLFKTPHHPTFKLDLHLNVVDVALATSAAPTYFPLAEIGDSLFADGGLYANSPDLFAVHEAEHFLDQSRQSLHLLSIGTTSTQFSFAHAQGRNFGLLRWVKEQRLSNVIISSQQQSVHFITSHQLGDRYLRLDATQSKEQERHLALDVATTSAQKTIKGLAAATIQTEINNPRLSDFLRHEAPPPKFFNT